MRPFNANGRPDGAFDALVTRNGAGGATTSFAHNLFLARVGEEIDYDHPNFVADKADGITVHWENPRLLVLSYSRARIFRYSNFWQAPVGEALPIAVEIRLVQTGDS